MRRLITLAEASGRTFEGAFGIDRSGGCVLLAFSGDSYVHLEPMFIGINTRLRDAPVDEELIAAHPYRFLEAGVVDAGELHEIEERVGRNFREELMRRAVDAAEKAVAKVERYRAMEEMWA